MIIQIKQINSMIEKNFQCSLKEIDNLNRSILLKISISNNNLKKKAPFLDDNSLVDPTKYLRSKNIYFPNFFLKIEAETTVPKYSMRSALVQIQTKI